MRIVFLDIDGVLNTYSTPVGRFSTGEPAQYLDRGRVECLNRLTAATGAQIVVTSDWRWFHEFPVLRRALREAGVRGAIAGATPTLGVPRWEEVEAWLVEHGRPESFVILDDDHDFEHLEPRRVRTNRRVGLTDREVERAIEMLELTDRLEAALAGEDSADADSTPWPRG